MKERAKYTKGARKMNEETCRWRHKQRRKQYR